LVYYRTDVPETASELFDGELVIAHYGSGLYFSLSPVGALIWQGLRHGLSDVETAAWLSEKLSGNAAEMASASLDFVGQLAAEGLIIAVDSRATSGELPVVPAGVWQAPVVERFDDLQELLLLDPVHDVSEAGWPHRPDDAGQ